MRKNGVNRNVIEINGGLCAPDGFCVMACACGIREDGDDLALVLADRRCSAAAVFSNVEKCGAPSVISKKHLRDGYARAIVVNGGVANVFLEKGDKLADKVCGFVERKFIIRKEDVLIASTGAIGQNLSLENFEKGVFDLSSTVDKRNGAGFVRAIAGDDGIGGETAYSFELGAFPCKIGVIYKANSHVCPNMATTLLFLTTDVNISPEMLKKAFSHAIRETLNGLNIDGISSPNDAAFILASGTAGNCKIEYVDTEYNKFEHALQSVLAKICLAIITGGNRKGFVCQVKGVKSKQLARTIARSIVGADSLKIGLASGCVDVDGTLYILSELDAIKDISKVKIAINTPQSQFVVFEDGKKVPQNQMLFSKWLSEKAITIEVDLGEGNYRATSYGCAR